MAEGRRETLETIILDIQQILSMKVEDEAED